MTAAEISPGTDSATTRSAPGAGGIRRVFRVERRKLAAQLQIRLLALVCLLAPFVFAVILKVQSGSPSDTLYGVWVHSSGFALSLVILAFAGSWGFPLMAGIVAGDLFSAEDRYGTWKLVLTRSCSRSDVFLGKLLAGATFVAGLVALTAAASIVAGVLVIGAHSLVSLNGTVLSPGTLLALVLLGWLLCMLPALAFASLGVLFSVATRNGIMGVIGPALVALAMQLLILVGAGIWIHMLLVASAFTLWHGLFTAPRYYGPLLVGVVVSVAWGAVCLSVAWRLLRGRDFAGTPVARRQGWVTPVRTALALTALIALLAIAGNWGPTGVTARRLQTSLTSTFDELTLLQQRQLGRVVPPGARLNIVPACSRHGSTSRGPGDWVCTLSIVIPAAGSLPPEPTVVSYDVSVQADGCYKAQSPPAFVGQQLMRDAHGRNVVNPLFTIYGCFDPM